MPTKIICSKCSSDQIVASQKEYIGGITLRLLTGNALNTLLSNFSDEKETKMTCLKCGNRFRPGWSIIKKASYEKGQTIAYK